VLGEVRVDARELQEPLGVSLLSGKNFLALLEIGDRDRLGQVGVNQLLALRLDPLKSTLLRVE
jgi:hypothetical protein